MALCSQWWLCCHQHNSSSNSHYQHYWSSTSWSTLPFSPGSHWLDQQRFYRWWGNHLLRDWMARNIHERLMVCVCVCFQVVEKSGLLNEAARVLVSLELSLNRGRHLSCDTNRVQLRVQKLQHTLTHMNVTERHCWGQTHRPVNRWERTPSHTSSTQHRGGTAGRVVLKCDVTQISLLCIFWTCDRCFREWKKLPHTPDCHSADTLFK